jgi:aminopeptidase N
MEIFAGLFGEYPFLEEKYGMAEFPWGGAMEHQTMTSIGAQHVSSSGTSRSIIAHELAHQWWGDLVTLSSWNDIWLNEGFATSSEVLFFERFLNLPAGELMSQSYDDGQVRGRLGGTVYAEDEFNPFDDTGAIYTKGAWILHMLRRILGDGPFFEALKDYGRRFSFGNATTRDFQQVCEEHYGQSLDWFFQQWIFAEARPVYKITSNIGPRSSSGVYKIKLTVKQTQTHSIPGRGGEPANFYFMPVDVQIHYADGSLETRVVFNDARKQKFSFTVPKQPVRIGFDEQNWILKKVTGQ